MKLAEALNRRADLQRKVSQIRERLNNNVKVQEGDEPAEQPTDLFEELDKCLAELGELVTLINKTNQETLVDGETITSLIAQKDMCKLRHSVLRSALNEANDISNRYTRNEIKIVRTVDVGALQKEVDEVARSIRLLDTKLQEANWTTNLVTS